MPQEGIASAERRSRSWIAPSTSPPTILRISALPTTTPSANAQTSAACAGVPIPTPTSNGRSVWGRSAATTAPGGLLHAVAGAGHAVRGHAVDEAA